MDISTNTALNSAPGMVFVVRRREQDMASQADPLFSSRVLKNAQLAPQSSSPAKTNYLLNTVNGPNTPMRIPQSPNPSTHKLDTLA